MTQHTKNPFSFSNLLQPFKKNFQSPRQPGGTGAPATPSTSPFNIPKRPSASPFSVPRRPVASPFGLGAGAPSSTPAPNMSTPTGPVFAPAPSFAPTGAIPQVTSQTTPQAPTAPPVPRTPSGLTEEQALAIQDARGATKTTPDGSQAPPVAPETKTAVDSAEKAFIDSQKVTENELKTQEDIDNLITSTNKAFLNTSNQPIPLEFITGQLKSIEQRALGLIEPLESKLARQQAKRTSAIEASKFALDRADKAAETRTGFTLKAGETRFDSAGNPVATIGTGGGQSSEEVSSWAELINQGKAKLSDVPNALKTSVAGALSQVPQGAGPGAKRAVEQSQVALTALEDVLNSPALQAGAISRTLQAKIPGTEDFDFARSLDTVKALIGFDQLQKMREASPTGGALGQVSERELGFLQTVAGSLDIGQSTEQLQKNLQAIRESFETLRLINSPDGTAFELNGVQYVKQGDSLVPQDFNEVEGDTNQAQNRPQRNNNPGNIKQGGLADKLAIGQDDQGHLIFPDIRAGFQALTEDIQAKIAGNSKVVGANPTIAQLGKVYAEDPNWPKSVAKILGVTIATKTADIDFNNLVQAIAQQEGFYA